MSNEKVRENYLRRMAKRQRLALVKSRAKKWNIDNYQMYMIVDPYFNRIEAGEKFNLSLDDVEKFFTDREDNLKR